MNSMRLGIPCNWNGQVKIANRPVGGNAAATFPTDANTVVAKGIDGAATLADADKGVLCKRKI